MPRGTWGDTARFLEHCQQVRAKRGIAHVALCSMRNSVVLHAWARQGAYSHPLRCVLPGSIAKVKRLLGGSSEQNGALLPSRYCYQIPRMSAC